ncbi:LysR family transcriptional regulator [Caballeronia sp. LZ034LL]|uniref:LysR family transcriptional regulator n=1 Tax=Caballeronia sp. LZ034LL TaxID=3038567 RepID=UPI002864A6B6|nr:LysR family transcriptional regulator [Caballeronia sp. LZ034LL]MDR5835672.1 LysR family transcriptional regulator [Caballeronia sp. LZ034LL]
MKLLSLRYFHEVARLGSIRRAADLLHVAPSAVSRQIAQLEADLDAVLFFRSKAGVALTNAGETYWRQTRRVMLDLANARQSLDDMRGLRRGEVRIHVIEGLVSDWLPRLVSEFRKLYPGIRFLIRSTSTDQIIAALLEHEADIGLTFNAPPRDEIQNIEEYVEPVSCLVSPDHRFADETQLKISQLIDEPMALAESSFGLRQLIERAFQRYRSEFEPAITTNSLELTKAMAMTGTMIAFMPTLTVQRELAEGLLRPIPVESKELSESRTSLCIHRDRALSFAARELLKVLRAEFRRLDSARSTTRSQRKGRRA